MWREFSRQYLLLHEERSPSRHSVSRSAAEALPNRWTSNARRDCRRQLWPKAISIRCLRHDSRVTRFHKIFDLLVSTARWPRRLDSHYAKVRRKTICLSIFAHFAIIFRMVSSYLVHHGYSSTAEKFADITGQSFTEDIASIKTRQSKSSIA